MTTSTFAWNFASVDSKLCDPGYIPIVDVWTTSPTLFEAGNGDNQGTFDRLKSADKRSGTVNGRITGRTLKCIKVSPEPCRRGSLPIKYYYASKQNKGCAAAN